MKSILWATAFLAILLAADAADARVPVPERAIYSRGSSSCSMFVDGCQFAGNLAGVADAAAKAEQSYYLTIKDGVSAGVDAFGFDATINSEQMVWRLARFAAAMKRYNGENSTAKKCIFVSYRSAGGEALAMFNTADSNNAADSPYCSVDGKPLVGVRSEAACVNPLLDLTGKGPFVVIGTMTGTTTGVPTAACVSTWKTNNASRVFSYLDPSADMNKSISAAKSAAETSGAEFALGIPSAYAKQCGGPECSGPAATGYTFRDGKGFLATLAAMEAVSTLALDRVILTSGFPGEWDEDSSFESAAVCDQNDTVSHNTSVGGINPNFTCPTVPSRMRGTIPMGNAALSYSNKAFQKAGFGRVLAAFNQQFRATEDPAATPFIAWAYREHPFALSGTGMAICPAASVTADAKSFGGSSGAGANSIYVTSQSPEAVKLRVKVGSTTLGTYTLPARQSTLTTADRQTVVPIGAARGRPTFEILDTANNVVKSKVGEAEYTDTPLQRSGDSGRNYSLFAGYMDFASAVTQAKASVVKVSADRAEGNTGTSTSTFRVQLDRPAAAASTVNWAVTSTVANAQDFYFFTDEGEGEDPQCEVSAPTPAAELGLTKLAFCDSFKYDSVARGSNANDRLIGGNKKWAGEDASHFGSLAYQPPGDFKHNATSGTMTLEPSVNQFQQMMQAHNKRGNTVTGFYIDRKSKGYYLEWRMRPIKFNSTHEDSKGNITSNIAIWSYDLCHWDAWPSLCPDGGKFLETDHAEFKNGTINPRFWKQREGGSGADRVEDDCSGPRNNDVTKTALNVWKTHGMRAEPASGPAGTPTLRRYGDNEVALFKNKNNCAQGADWFPHILTRRHPILIGMKRGDAAEFDFVRVWTHPDDE